MPGEEAAKLIRPVDPLIAIPAEEEKMPPVVNPEAKTGDGLLPDKQTGEV